jgi:hypothetical protein
MYLDGQELDAFGVLVDQEVRVRAENADDAVVRSGPGRDRLKIRGHS